VYPLASAVSYGIVKYSCYCCMFCCNHCSLLH